MENNQRIPAAGLFFQELLLSSSDSDGSEHDIEERGAQELHPRVQRFIEEVVDAMSDAEFRENFRMSRSTCDHIITLIGNKISTPVYARGRHTITAKQQILIALWYFATPDSFRSICGRFNVGKATALRSVRRVTEALCSLAPQVIVWPEGVYRQEVIQGFSQMGFPNTIGCIDGTYIRIPLPKDHGLAYVCRKNIPAIILQAICDNTMKFTHCYAGEAGSCHDARVLRESEIWSYMMERPEEKFPEDTHLIGDKAYPCLPELMTPFRDNGHLTNEQRNYNFLHARTRSTIERSFGLLHKRWRCLKDLLDVKTMEFIPKYVIACCVLHNICIMQNDFIEFLEGGNIQNYENREVYNRVDMAAPRRRQILGNMKRNLLCEEMNH